MPRYDFLCDTCKKVFEVGVPLKEYGKKIKCPYCKIELKRQLTAVLFRIK